LLETYVTFPDKWENFTWVSRDDYAWYQTVSRVCSQIVEPFIARARIICDGRDEKDRYKFCGDMLLCTCTFDAHEQGATVGSGGFMYCVLEFFWIKAVLFHGILIFHPKWSVMGTCRCVKIKLKSFNKTEKLRCGNFTYTFCIRCVNTRV